jgi:two-component system NarL family response regulator/two-component system response regulator DegU
MKTRILLVDDYEIVREGLRLMLQNTLDMEIVGGANDGASALAMATELMPDLILMDMELGDMDGIEASRQILEALPETRIMVLSGAVDSGMVSQGIDAGIKGFVVKTNIPGELIQGVRAVMEGNSYLCSDVSRHAVSRGRRFLTSGAILKESLFTTRTQAFFRPPGQELRLHGAASLLSPGFKMFPQVSPAPAKGISDVRPEPSNIGREALSLARP